MKHIPFVSEDFVCESPTNDHVLISKDDQLPLIIFHVIFPMMSHHTFQYEAIEVN